MKDFDLRAARERRDVAKHQITTFSLSFFLKIYHLHYLPFYFVPWNSTMFNKQKINKLKLLNLSQNRTQFLKSFLLKTLRLMVYWNTLFFNHGISFEFGHILTKKALIKSLSGFSFRFHVQPFFCVLINPTIWWDHCL